MEAPPRALTVKETAEATGLTIKAVRSRIERGTLPAVVRDGLRRIPYSELVRAGLIEADNGAAIGQLPRQGTADEAPQPDVLAELVNRLEAQAEELGRLKAITAAAETTSDQEHELVRILCSPGYRPLSQPLGGGLSRNDPPAERVTFGVERATACDHDVAGLL